MTPFTPFDAGSGRIDLARAGDPGITFDVTDAEYLALATHLWDANYPSVYVPECSAARYASRQSDRSVTCLGANTSWNAQDVDARRSDFTIKLLPKKLNVPANGSATFSVDARRARQIALGQVRHRTVTFEQDRRPASAGPAYAGHDRPWPGARWRCTKACAPADLSPRTRDDDVHDHDHQHRRSADATYVDPVRQAAATAQARSRRASSAGRVSGKDTVLVERRRFPASQPPNVADRPRNLAGRRLSAAQLPSASHQIGGVGRRHDHELQRAAVHCTAVQNWYAGRLSRATATSSSAAARARITRSTTRTSRTRSGRTTRWRCSGPTSTRPRPGALRIGTLDRRR